MWDFCNIKNVIFVCWIFLFNQEGSFSCPLMSVGVCTPIVTQYLSTLRLDNNLVSAAENLLVDGKFK